MTTTADIALLETRNLTKIYPGIEPVYAVKNVSLVIYPGEFMSIVGPSGSGKSTLMNLLGLLDTPSEGELQYFGKKTHAWTQTETCRFRNQEIGFIFQAHLLLPEFTALENLLIPARIGGSYSIETEQRAKTLLARMGLENRMHFFPKALSGGQNQRVAIARALMNQPSIVFADEPTGALDHKTSLMVYDLMRSMSEEDQVTFVIVTHERSFADKSDRMITLLDGEIQQDRQDLTLI